MRHFLYFGQCDRFWPFWYNLFCILVTLGLPLKAILAELYYFYAKVSAQRCYGNTECESAINVNTLDRERERYSEHLS